MKRFVSIIISIMMLISAMPVFAEPDITSKSAILMDYNTGKIIYALNENEKLPPASITKIMTLLLTMEAVDSGRISLDTKVVISDFAAGMGGTQVYLEPGEVQMVEDLVRATVIRSANDAAAALGEAISGSNEAFVALMNERAKQLGMMNTNFENSTGLPSENHYTTAYDVALMSREVLKHEYLKKYMTSYMEDLVVGKKKNDTQVMVNTNKLIRQYDGVTGIKTGHTQEAGHCISASAKRGELELIAVILGGSTSDMRFTEAKKLLDHGFANYQISVVGKKGDIISTLQMEKSDKVLLDLVLKEDVYALMTKDDNSGINKEIVLKDNISSPINKGDVLGQMIVSVDNGETYKVDLVAEDNVAKAGFFLLLKRTTMSFITGN